MKEQTLKMDSVDIMYLFGDNFEEKLSKVLTVKQKSKPLLTGLLKQNKQSNSSYGMNSLPFQQSPLPQYQQSGRGRGFLLAKAANRRDKSLFEKLKLSTAELRGAKSNFISHNAERSERKS